MKNSLFHENEFSIFGKAAAYLPLIMATSLCAFNIFRGIVPTPYAFIITIAGFMLFLIAKTFVISKGIAVSFGTKVMSPTMANVYLLGYWLMIVGILSTFEAINLIISGSI
ncbi:hypothetical protein [Methylomonas sp. AM2-LC]|uniref:hypothetical protein n=1 Tax=Methylomonas sp. AM2-LC TaxID=3153301 RepID=UPI0032674673